ncbi:prolipoprotein diacylglyceryl transferase [Smaragdicoccus niigatensis]|uniref:prolipoprotein diacylglyceryl transferase n=1 Tax=Smaragdicoccus niigatensis TaxID=359359 RepID=UPI00037AE6A0|nr:prolipoprotein diacylglyceryl transferase family protein [Smaragdicoccus niigatensis]
MTAGSNILPRFFTLRGYQVSTYQVFLILGIWIGTMTAARVAEVDGYSPLRTGVTAMVCGLAGVVGSRLLHVVVHRGEQFTTGGLSLFGSLLTFVPASILGAQWIGTPVAALWDQMAVGVLAGGFWIRLGCVFNGCCVGRPTRFGLRLHDTRGVVRRRIPVQFVEQAWWLLGLVAYAVAWPDGQPAGSVALAVLSFYGVGRFFLEPLREDSDVIFDRVRLNQLIAALLAISAGVGLVALQT